MITGFITDQLENLAREAEQDPGQGCFDRADQLIKSIAEQNSSPSMLTLLVILPHPLQFIRPLRFPGMEWDKHFAVLYAGWVIDPSHGQIVSEEHYRREAFGDQKVFLKKFRYPYLRSSVTDYVDEMQERAFA